HDNCVCGPIRTVCKTVCGDDDHLRPNRCEDLTGSLREMRVDFDTNNVACPTNDFGEDGGIVAGAGPNMDNMLATSEPELIKQTGPKARLTIVETSLFVDRDQNVMIEMRRIGTFRCPVIRHSDRAQETPRARPGKLLAFDCGESFDHGSRLHPSGMPQFFGKPPPGLFDTIVHQLRPCKTNPSHRGMA